MHALHPSFLLVRVAFALWALSGCAPDGSSRPPVDAMTVDLGPALDRGSQAEPDAALAADARMDRAVDPRDVACGAIAQAGPFTADGPDRWQAHGVVHGGSTEARGSCGGRGPEFAAEFVAPRDGLYAITGDGSPVFSPTLYVREACGDPDSERVCGFSADTERSGRVELRATAGERLWVFADARGGRPGTQAEVRLSISRADGPVAPRVSSMRVVGSTGGARLQAQVADDNGDLEGAALRWLDVAGRGLGDAIELDVDDLYARWAGEIEASFADAPPDAVAAELTVRDGGGLVATARAPLSPPAQVEPGVGCDLDGIVDRCSAGRCVRIDGAPICVVRDRPTLHGGRARREDALVWLRLATASPDARLVRATVILADAFGAPLTHPMPRIIRRESRRADGVVEFAVRPVVRLDVPDLAIVWLEDDRGRTSARRALPIRESARLADGAVCDPDGYAGDCPQGRLCAGEGDVRRCRALRPITGPGAGAELWVDPIRGRYSLTASVISPDSAWPREPRVSFVVDGIETGDDDRLMGDGNVCRHRLCTLRGAGILPSATRRALEAGGTLHGRIDLSLDPGGPANLIELAGRPVEEIAPGAPCGDSVSAACSEGMVCGHPVLGDVCRPFTVPVVIEAEVRFVHASLVVARVVWADPALDTRGIELQFMTAAGEPLVFETWSQSYRGARRLDDQGRFEQMVTRRLRPRAGDRPLDAIARVAVRIVDAHGPPSDWVEAERTEVVMLDEGERCDRYGEFDQCAEGLVCGDRDFLDDDATDRCEPDVLTCPAGWTVGGFERVSDMLWSGAGDTTDAPVYDRFGHSLSGAIHVFTAPTDGWFRFEAQAEHLALPQQLQVELRDDCVRRMAASWQFPAEFGPVHHLRAGESIHVLVHRLERRIDGPYTVRVARLPAPVVDEAEVQWTAHGWAATVELRWPAEGVDPVEVELHRVYDDGRSGRFASAAVAVVDEVDGQRVGRAQFTFRDATPAWELAEIVAEDVDGVRSRPLGVRVQPARLVGAGAACDPVADRAACAPEWACPDPASGREMVCQAMPDTCPADWPVHDLEDAMWGDGWAVLGGGADGFSVPAAITTCGASSGAADIHRFVAPEAGDYWMYTSGGVPIATIRRMCGAVRDVCPAEGWPRRSTALTLQAGEVIYIFVGGADDTVPPYVLRVGRLEHE